MPPKVAATDAEGRKQPTAAEAFLFYSIIKHMKGKPEVDWALVATDAGLKNAETAKVRYGQIKRKLGLDTWTPSKPKATATTTAAAEDGDAAPDTPTPPKSARSRKTAATPSTPGTGAGVKKRGGGGSATKRATPSTGPGTGRGRKPKPQALLNLPENPAANGSEFDDADLDDELLLTLASPTPATKRGRQTTAVPPAAAAAANLGPANHTNPAAASPSLMADYAAFPATLPEMVLARKAILVFFGGSWTLAPATAEAHARWLARLPASVQTRFYMQENGVGTKDGGGEDEEVAYAYQDGEAAAAASGSGTIGLGYLDGPVHGAAAAVPAAGTPFAGDAPKAQMHPGYAAEMELAQEARDRDALFGGGAADEEEEVGAV